MPKVSVIIPAYNAERYLAQAIESVLAQTYRDYEIIVVDDGSTDKTGEIVASYGTRVEYIYQQNQERSAARNNGVAKCGGEYLLFLDADDLLLSDALLVQAELLKSHPEVGLVAAGYQLIDERGRILQTVQPWKSTPFIGLRTILLNGLAPIHAILIRREWFERVGGFDIRFSGGEDMDLWYRLSLAGCPMTWLRDVVCQYRIHNSNSSRDVTKHYTALFAVLEGLFSRRELSNDITSQKSSIYAQIRLAEAGRLFAADQTQEGRDCIQQALELDPSLCDLSDDRLAESIAAWKDSIWIGADPAFFGIVFGNLPASVASPVWVEKIKHVIMRKEFYKAFERGHYRGIPGRWLSIARRDATWMLNRGNWSILLRSLARASHDRTLEA